MSTQKPKPELKKSQSVTKKTWQPESVNPKQRKLLAHNAPVRRAASKFRG